VTQARKETGDYLKSPDGPKGPDAPSADSENSDWATSVKAQAEQKAKERDAIKPPIYELLIQQFTSLWKASSQAVDVATQQQALTQANRQTQVDSTTKSAPLVYTDPSKVRKTSSAEGT
jgi:hypothetical protein